MPAKRLVNTVRFFIAFVIFFMTPAFVRFHSFSFDCRRPAFFFSATAPADAANASQTSSEAHGSAALITRAASSLWCMAAVVLLLCADTCVMSFRSVKAISFRSKVV